MHRNPIYFLYNSGHVTLRCVEVGPVAIAMEGSMQEHDRARVGRVICMVNLEGGGGVYSHENTPES